jgi:hypothetical protein
MNFISVYYQKKHSCEEFLKKLEKDFLFML